MSNKSPIGVPVQRMVRRLVRFDTDSESPDDCCEECGRDQDVGGANALARGWPECHGYTMTLMRPNVES